MKTLVEKVLKGSNSNKNQIIVRVISAFLGGTFSKTQWMPVQLMVWGSSCVPFPKHNHPSVWRKHLTGCPSEIWLPASLPLHVMDTIVKWGWLDLKHCPTMTTVSLITHTAKWVRGSHSAQGGDAGQGSDSHPALSEQDSVRFQLATRNDAYWNGLNSFSLEFVI